MDSRKSEKKRKRSRKARTQVSSSPSSSPSPKSSPPPQNSASTSTSKNPRNSTARPASSSPSPETQPESQLPPSPSPTKPQNPNTQNPDQAFSEFYLQQATREFATDLEKLRNAPDFHGESSVEILVAALRQGTGCFSGEERARVGKAVLEAGSRAELGGRGG